MSTHTQPIRTLSEAQNLRIGVIGDGQLAQMMAEAAQVLGLNFYVFAAHLDSPAAKISSNVTLGVLDNSLDFINFCQDKDIITIESEFIDPMILATAGSKVLPFPESLNCLRDRLPQKESLIHNHIPTSPIHQFNDLTDAKDWMSKHNKGLVFKKRLFGYDGYGTRIIKNAQDLLALEKENLKLDEWIAEELILFHKELAISFARNSKGQVMEFPLVESHQQDSKCLWVKGPVTSSPFQKTIEALKNYVNTMNFVGLISFELFLTEEGLLVNEVAPRVHNSAHYSIEALNISQFQAHLMAITNMELPQKPEIKNAFAMYNLIGEQEASAEQLQIPASLPDDIYLHWYQKSQSRKGRKMGHITSLADTSEKALLKLEDARKDFKL